MDSKFADKFKIDLARLVNWNYSTTGNYFITICSCNHNNFLGKVDDEKIVLSKMGMIAHQCLMDISKHFANGCLTASIVMPNHVHILVQVETPYMASLPGNRKITLINYSHKNHPNYFSRLSEKSKQLIPKIIQQYKSAVTRQINPKTVFFGWQSGYHCIIIESEIELLKIKNYINNNPKNWQKDKFYN